jgi:hypothetical protein
VVAAASERGLRVAAIDLDWLGWSTGAGVSVDDLIARNLAAVASNYAAANIQRIVVARAFVDSRGLTSVAKSMRGWELTVLNLQASRSTLEARIRLRDSGSELEEHLAELEDMVRQTDSAVPTARTVDNDARPLREVAVDVMRLSGWIG